MYGSADRSGNVTLSRAGLEPGVGFMIESALTGDGTGTSVAGTGDVNGDGYDDVVIGAPGMSSAGSAGDAYVVYGSEAHGTVTLEPSGLPASVGFVVQGPAAGSMEASTGSSVAGGADVNGDGIDDTVISAPGAGYLTGGGSVPDIGEVAVVYGVMGGRGTVALPKPDEPMSPGDGFTIRGPSSESWFSSPLDPPAGTQTVAVGDVNGDGRADVIVGSGFYGGEDGLVVGALGFGKPSLAYPTSGVGINGQPLELGPEAVGRTGATSYSISPGLPAGLALDPATGRIAGTPLQPQPSLDYTVTMRDLVGTATATFSLAVGDVRQEATSGAGDGRTGSNAMSVQPGPSPPTPSPSPSRLVLVGVRIAPRTLEVNAAGKVRRAPLTFHLSAGAAVQLRIQGRGRPLVVALGDRPAGTDTVSLRGVLRHRTVPTGRYRATVTARAFGERVSQTIRFRVAGGDRGSRA